jgi:hypothetical protein
MVISLKAEKDDTTRKRAIIADRTTDLKPKLAAAYENWRQIPHQTGADAALPHCLPAERLRSLPQSGQ